MKKLLIIAAVCGFLVLLAAAVLAALFATSASARRAWKDKAITEIAARVAHSQWASNEISTLKNKATPDSHTSDGWLSDHLILMRNGDWMAFKNICNKENRRIRDLFVGRGSDGRWYYSTYHFCVGMLDLKMEEQPNDLDSFSKIHYLRQFDGKSDECLQKTWPAKSK